MKRFIVVFLGVLGLALPARAAEMSLFALKSPDALAAPGTENNPRNLQDYANIFYGNCIAGGSNPEMSEYIKNQCACAAAALPDILTLEQAQALFGQNSLAGVKYPYTRFMLLGYAPCLEDSLRDIAFDECVSSPANQKLRYRRAVCECIGKGARDYAKKWQHLLIPGLKDGSYDPELAEDDPLSWALGFKGFGIQMEYHNAKCLQTEELGW